MKDKIITETMELVRVLYADDKEFIGYAAILCVRYDRTEDDPKFNRDLSGFITYARDKKLNRGEVFTTILHDLRGFCDKDKFFLPRTHGFCVELNNYENA